MGAAVVRAAATIPPAAAREAAAREAADPAAVDPAAATNEIEVRCTISDVSAFGSTNRTATASKPRVAITMGDPAGIGPEVAARAAADPRVLAACEPRLYGPPSGVSFQPGV